jgi:NAD(P)-dependent dehydrogenase (short-subunit alcohol dehydrogenase family)
MNETIMKMHLEGKVVLITGGSKGIGRACARMFLDCGAYVAITGRRPDALAAARGELGSEVMTFPGNVADEQHAAETVAAIIAQHDRLDLLVNNAATSPYFGPAHRVDLPSFDKTWSVNVRSPLVWIQQAWLQSMQQRGGCVVNIASLGALLSCGPTSVYNVTKAALVSLTKQLATELGPGVRVNAVAPGLVKTAMSTALWNTRGADARYPWPLERLGRPEDIAGAVAFLCSDLASWITGHIMVVDGGALCAAEPSSGLSGTIFTPDG